MALDNLRALIRDQKAFTARQREAKRRVGLKRVRRKQWQRDNPGVSHV
ncbi:MAG: hypothetical protein AAFV53_00215 [Myxococcota bacterium]